MRILVDKCPDTCNECLFYNDGSKCFFNKQKDKCPLFGIDNNLCAEVSDEGGVCETNPLINKNGICINVACRYYK